MEPFSGNYFFTARQDDAEANHTLKDQMAQTITLNRPEVAKGKLTAKLGFMSNGWGDGDHDIVGLIVKDAHGNALKSAETQTKGEQKKW